MKNKMKVFGLVHAVLMLIALVLAQVSSSMSYAMKSMPWIIAVLAGALAVDVLIAFGIRKRSVPLDVCMLITTVLSTMAMCMIFLGRADLMGYVWFSDLESGNIVAVTSLYLACGSMLCCLAGAIMNIADSFRKPIRQTTHKEEH